MPMILTEIELNFAKWCDHDPGQIVSLRGSQQHKQNIVPIPVCILERIEFIFGMALNYEYRLPFANFSPQYFTRIAENGLPTLIEFNLLVDTRRLPQNMPNVHYFGFIDALFAALMNNFDELDGIILARQEAYVSRATVGHNVSYSVAFGAMEYIKEPANSNEVVRYG